MAFQNAAVVVTPTSITVTGGTAVSFSPLAVSSNQVDLIVPSDTDTRLRRSLTAKFNRAVASMSGTIQSWSMNKTSMMFRKPKLLSRNSQTITNYIEIKLVTDVETTAAEIQELIDVGAQMLIDTDFVNTWKIQSTL